MSDPFLVDRLQSSSSLQVAVGLSCIYLGEFLQQHLGPLLSRVLKIAVGSFLPNFLQPSHESLADIKSSDVSSAIEAVKEEIEMVEKEVEAVFQATKLQSHEDDRKASRGTENDLYMLKTHGYIKHRFVSDTFLKRNNLKRATVVDTDED